MMTTNMERALRRLLSEGGRLSLPGRDGPIRIEVERAGPGFEQDVAFALVAQGDWIVTQYGNWKSRELYPEIAERLDQLTPDTYAATEVPA